MRPFLRLFLAAVASLWLTSLAQAQTHSWTGGSDNWNDATNWNVGSIPNDPSHWALIGQSGPLQVTPDINVTLDRLDLTGTDANLFTNGRTLTILSNAGQVNTFQVSGATGSGQIVIVYGLALGSTASGVCSGVDFGIDAAQQVGAGFASTNGNALVSANVPAGAAGMTANFQALDLERCELSDVTSFVFP